jgi:hypothetical protein
MLPQFRFKVAKVALIAGTTYYDESTPISATYVTVAIKLCRGSVAGKWD